MFKEGGKGRGMIVPNLLEVELSQGRDVAQIVAQVLTLLPQIADHAVSFQHTIFSLSLSVPRRNLNGTTGADSSESIGRISFLLLSPTHRNNTFFGWTQHVQRLGDWLRKGSSTSSPPFYKCRLLLYLRDAIMRRQRVSVNHILCAERDQRGDNEFWLTLFAHLTAESADANADAQWTVPKEEDLSGKRKPAMIATVATGAGSTQSDTKRSSTPNRRMSLSTAPPIEKASTLRRVNSNSKLHDLQHGQQLERNDMTKEKVRSSSTKRIEKVQPNDSRRPAPTPRPPVAAAPKDVDDDIYRKGYFNEDMNINDSQNGEEEKESSDDSDQGMPNQDLARGRSSSEPSGTPEQKQQQSG
jgi:hypothetical protein